MIPFLVFRSSTKKTTQKTRICYPYRNSKILGKEGNTKKNKLRDFLAKRKEGIQKTKERKNGVVASANPKGRENFKLGGVLRGNTIRGNRPERF